MQLFYFTWVDILMFVQFTFASGMLSFILYSDIVIFI